MAHVVTERCVDCKYTDCCVVCPSDGFFEIENPAMLVIDPNACIDCGLCAAECPVGAIKLVFGSAERGVDLPEVDAFFESSRPGVHVVGELGGMGLIKNAMTQGFQVADRLAGVVPRGAAPVVVLPPRSGVRAPSAGAPRTARST